LRAAPGGKTKPNSIITGTGPGAFVGVVRVSWISTVMAGYEELSTWPASFFTVTGVLAFDSWAVLTNSQVTLGVLLGTRP